MAAISRDASGKVISVSGVKGVKVGDVITSEQAKALTAPKTSTKSTSKIIDVRKPSPTKEATLVKTISPKTGKATYIPIEQLEARKKEGFKVVEGSIVGTLADVSKTPTKPKPQSKQQKFYNQQHRHQLILFRWHKKEKLMLDRKK